MPIDSFPQTAPWSPAAPVGTATLEIHGAEAPDDLVIRIDGTELRDDTPAAHLQPGLTGITVPFQDGTTRTVHILTSPADAPADDSAEARRSWRDRIAHARSLTDDALTIVVRPLPHRQNGDEPAPSHTSVFARQAVRAGAHLILHTRADADPHVEVVRESLSVIGGRVSIDLRRDWRAGALLAALVATWGPWFTYQERTIFTFYTIVMVPFVVLAITYGLGLVWGRAGQGSWLQTRRIAVGVVLALAVLAFAFFWPVWTATYIPHEAWQLRMWNPTWI